MKTDLVWTKYKNKNKNKNKYKNTYKDEDEDELQTIDIVPIRKVSVRNEMNLTVAGTECRMARVMAAVGKKSRNSPRKRSPKKANLESKAPMNASTHTYNSCKIDV